MQPRRPQYRSILLALTLLYAASGAGGEATTAAAPPERLRVSENGRWLVNAGGRPLFLLADTAWSLAMRVNRDEAAAYLRKRREQRFNAVTFVLFTPGKTELTDGLTNCYGHAPFKIVNGQADPAQPDVRPGPDNDFWDQADWLVALTKRLGLYAVVLPTWGSGVVGDYSAKDTNDIAFNEANAYAYGRWLGERYRNEPHLLWMLGGDRRAVYENPLRDFRPVFRAMARGLAEGSGGTALMSFHPPKGSPQSGDWFHAEGWLSFNSLQHWPEEQVPAIGRDWTRTPAKPTWVFEGRYEGYWKSKYRPEDWGEWQTRQQAYQTVFAGAFGHTYGHERVFGFGQDGADWKAYLEAPGARSMAHLAKLMNRLAPNDLLTRVPDQSLLAGETGEAERLKSDRVTATRTGSRRQALFYSANGRMIRVKLDQLAAGKLCAWWFNPRNGRWHVNGEETEEQRFFARDIGASPDAPVREFVPPTSGEGQDWVLILGAAEGLRTP